MRDNKLGQFGRGPGFGTVLLKAVESQAQISGVRRLWLVTTNDNQMATEFHQRRGFGNAAIHAAVVVRSRRLKPSIPEFGNDGIPINDELEMKKLLVERP
jgi:GNAT superfamily N-acetyltransferase